MEFHRYRFLSFLPPILAAAAYFLTTAALPEDFEPHSKEGFVLSASVQRGKGIYERRCIGCHSPDHNRAGPKHRGVFNRPAGAVPDYAYSMALTESGLVWDAPTLDRWLENPVVMVPGTAMGFSLSDARERADVIAYLANLTTQHGHDSGLFKLAQIDRVCAPARHFKNECEPETALGGQYCCV